MTATHALLIEVRWPDGRFHGVREAPRGSSREVMAAEWPPSPFRLFQALVAGAYGGRWTGEEATDVAGKDAAFAWLERQAAPVIVAPPAERLEAVTYFVPNNDLDTREGDPARVNEIRAPKTLRTSAFDPDRSVAYLWRIGDGLEEAARLVELSARLHTLGLGLDAAFAEARVLDEAAAGAWLQQAPGVRLDPAPGPAAAHEAGAPCPAIGSLESLKLRHGLFTRRLERVGSGRRSGALFRQPPKPQARSVAYARRPVRRLYELRPLQGERPFATRPLSQAYAVAVRVRDVLAMRLGPGDPRVERFVTGREAGAADAGRRVRILPLPSIGGVHTDPGIRRVLVELPVDCPLSPAELDWALSGQELIDPETGEAGWALLAPSDDWGMARHYGVDTGAARTWRTVTPAALTEGAARRRLDPARLAAGEGGERKTSGERTGEETRAAAAVQAALRHAGLPAAIAVRVQREPFSPQLERAEACAADRFRKERLWHVEVELERPVQGPLAIGDGRFCGLGLLAPPPPAVSSAARAREGLFAFEVMAERPIPPADAPRILQAVRRALMSRARDALALPLFSGHEDDGAPARSGQHRHAYLAQRPGPPMVVWVAAPWRVDRTLARRERRKAMEAFRVVVEGLREVRAGRLGVLDLQPIDVAGAAIAGRARAWVSATPYRPDRHPRRGEAPEAAVVRDVQAACARLGLPRPAVDVTSTLADGRAMLALQFATQVWGPILAGRDAHLGGGLFLPSER